MANFKIKGNLEVGGGGILGGKNIINTNTTVNGKTSLPTSNSEYREVVLGQNNSDKLVFYQQFSHTNSTATSTINFVGGAFKEILQIWVDQATTTDSRSERFTLTGFTLSSYSMQANLNHRINVIGLK